MNKLKNKIIKLLKSHPRGLTITDIVKMTSRARTTVTKRLAELKAENKVEIRKVAMAKLHYWKGAK